MHGGECADTRGQPVHSTQRHIPARLHSLPDSRFHRPTPAPRARSLALALLPLPSPARCEQIEKERADELQQTQHAAILRGRQRKKAPRPDR